MDSFCERGNLCDRVDLNCSTRQAPYTLQVTPLSVKFSGFPSLNDARLTARQNTRQVYDAVHARVTSGRPERCLVEGTIGKSYNLLYLLRRLLDSNRIVVFYSAWKTTQFAFVPPQDLYEDKRRGGSAKLKCGHLLQKCGRN